MKTGLAAAVATLALAAAGVDCAAVRGFGPANCVSISRSSAGTCVLRTNCAGQDLSSFDISFECVADSGREAHSLGRGSFDEQEEYDTDIKCQECLAPVSKAPIAHPTLAKQPEGNTGVSLAAVSVSRAHENQAQEPSPKAEWYGPEECVGVWRDDKSGTCIMQTDCDEDIQLNVYEFGLICMQDLEMTRHIFGMDSFAHKETFSTLISCDQCKALDEYMDGTKAVNALTSAVKGMKDDMKNVTGEVVKLKAEVFPQAAPGPGPAPAPASAKPAKFLAQPRSHAQATRLHERVMRATPEQDPAQDPAAPQQLPEPQQVQLVQPVQEPVQQPEQWSQQQKQWAQQHPLVQQPSSAKHEEVTVEVGAQQHEVVEHLKKKASQAQSSAATAQPSDRAPIQAIQAAQVEHAKQAIEYVEDKTPAQSEDADADDDESGDANDDDGFRRPRASRHENPEGSMPR